jgi:hypothetical protein
VSVLEGLGALARRQAGEAAVAVDEGQDEEGGLVAAAGHHDVGAAEVALPVGGGVGEWHEDLGLGLLELGDGGADDALAAGVVVLGAEAVVDAPRRVSLLGGCGKVVAEDLLNDG